MAETEPITVVAEYAVCGCCLIALANADTSGHDYYCGDEPEPMSLHFGDTYSRMVADGEELGFSWYGCDGCGSRLGGDRYKVVMLSR